MNTGCFAVATELGDVAVRLHGAGPLVVTLHANPGDGRDFDAVAGRLSQRNTVAVIDWPGYGDSAAVDPSKVTAPALAQILGVLMEAILARVEQRSAVLVGNSVGGYAALRQALEHPERVTGLVLIAPGGFTRLTPINRALCQMMSTPAIARWLAGPLASGYTWRRTPASRAALRRAYALRRDPQRLGVYCAIWKSFLDPAHDLRRRVGSLGVPVLLTWGWGDPVLSRFADGRRAARLMPAARLHSFWSGHEPHAEVPERWLAVVSPFLHALPATRGAR